MRAFSMYLTLFSTVAALEITGERKIDDKAVQDDTKTGMNEVSIIDEVRQILKDQYGPLDFASEKIRELVGVFEKYVPFMVLSYEDGVGKDAKKKECVLEFELFWKTAPKTAVNFAMILLGVYDRHPMRGSGRMTYSGMVFHRNIHNFVMQGGETLQNGEQISGSIYGKPFWDEYSFPYYKKIEKEEYKHKKGVLSMANAGPDTNTSQFFITFAEQPHLNGMHVVFGKVKEAFMSGVDAINDAVGKRGENEGAAINLTVVSCGFREPKEKTRETL